jgi:hypothetical protein
MTTEFHLNKFDLISKSITTQQFSSDYIFTNDVNVSLLTVSDINIEDTAIIFGDLIINGSGFFEEVILTSLVVDDLVVNDPINLLTVDNIIANTFNINEFETISFETNDLIVNNAILTLTIDDLIVNKPIQNLEINDFTLSNLNILKSFKTNTFLITPISTTNIENIIFNAYKIGNLCYFHVSFDIIPTGVSIGARRNLGQIDDSENFPIERFTISMLHDPVLGNGFPVFPLRVNDIGLIDFQCTIFGNPGSYFGGGSYLVNS